MVNVADRGEAVGERCERVSAAHENVSLLHLKHVIGEVSVVAGSSRAPP
jgi:hypothetical protein